MYVLLRNSQGHIDDAVNVNWLGTILLRRKKFDKTKPVLYIVKWKQKQKGNQLNELGFKNIYELTVAL
jgi:hypothetical protein